MATTTRLYASLLLRTLLVLLTLSAALTAQQPTDNNPAFVLRADAQRRAEWATTWLRSEDSLRVAWGAWVARQDRAIALTPLLIEKVEEYQSADGPLFQSDERERHDALLVVLDALIALGAALPANQARKLYPEFAAQSLILLLRSRDDAQPALLDILQHAKANGNWLAAGNILFKNRTPGFGWVLLSGFTQHLTVSVVDQGTGGGVGGGGSECAFSLRAPKTNWPPVGLYWVTQFPDRMPQLTATLLAGGETPVYYWRVESGNYDNPPDASGSCDDGNRDEYRAQYVNRLLQDSNRLNAYPHETIEWHGDAFYRQQLLAIVEKQRARFRQVLMSLQQSGSGLTMAEAGTLQTRLEIVVLDYRSNRSTPLSVTLDNGVPLPVRTTFSKPLP